MKLSHLLAMKAAGERIATLTAYDYPTARLLDEAGIDCLLVGDSLGMVVLGYPDTTLVTMDEMLHHTRAVCRGGRRAPVVADLPFGAYATPELAVANGRQLVAAGADAVKLEGGRTQLGPITALRTAGLEVVGHLGMLPQSVRIEGGYRIKGKTPQEADALLEDALAIEQAGVSAMVLELVQPDTARRISEALRIPTIGIGSGRGCDGEVLVTPDLIGAFPWFTPKFVKPRGDVAGIVTDAVRVFVQATKARESMA